MTDTRPDSGDIEAVGNTTENLDTISINSGPDIMEDKNDMFVSALDSPTDSGLAGLETLDISANNNEEANITPSSDTMEDLSLQDDGEISIEETNDDVKPSPPEERKEPAVVPPEIDVNLDDDLGVSEVNLDDDDDIFKSARLEPEPAKASSTMTNGFSRATSEEPAETDIPLEDDEHPFEDAHLKPGLQLSGPSPTPATIQQQTLTSFHEEEAKREMEGGDEFIEINVTSPHKVGDGMSSYMAYKVTTNTNLTYFKKNKPEVNRRFSDFLGLRDKLTEKYLQNGRIIPPAPDKSVIGMTKVKMSKEDETSNQSEFVEKRRASLERYLNRTASHPNLRVDPDFREFLELDTELPKANQTAALSGKNVMKLISKVGDRVSQYTTKMEETDQWFEEKTVMIDNLDLQLRKLLVATESLVDYRKALSGHTYSLSKSLGMLGSAEDNSKLSAAIAQLAEVEEKVEKVHEQQAKDDFYLLSELVHDYIGIVGAVKDAFNERVKAWQSWQSVQRDLNKRRENKVKAELASKQDRVNQLRQEIAENERQLDMAQENFEKISRIIKKEFDAFDVKKCKDFKNTITKYLENMLKSQESLVTHWERFLPEIKQMEP
eukprot:TRINITY_DN6688_c0_g1_i1.p1 TRINITY_DN6688_c0_g1~~TRINITY_DN6688_c0_g1_i1.p1  ORF type:complete len:606 (-),score=254.41 TRINITY_DN6688_c0_g1_i1:244-2061(-)